MALSAKRIIIIALLLFTICLLVGVSIHFYKTLQEKKQHVQENNGLTEEQTAANLSEMAAKADVIVVGTYVGLHSTVNMARNPQNPDAESEETYRGAKVFHFEISDWLKGETATDTIKIAHYFSNPFEIGETLGYKDEEVEDVDPTYLKPVYHTTYIAFIQQAEFGDMYVRAMEPFLMLINDGEVKVKSNVLEKIGFDDSISGQSLEEVKAKIEKLK